MEQQLINIGLTPLQARSYLYLLGKDSGIKPALLAKHLEITRTNCYKVLDQLAELDLVRRTETKKTFTYFAEDPIALTSIAGRARAHANDLEKRVQSSLKLLRAKHKKSGEDNIVESANGKSAILQAFHTQNTSLKPIYFIKSQLDAPFMGFDTMKQLRTEPAKYGTQRYGITPDTPEAPINPEIDKQSNLTRTWFKSGEYASPVEWTSSGDELAILVYDGNGKSVRIKDPIIADSFRQLWKAFDNSLRSAPDYYELPKKARREL